MKKVHLASSGYYRELTRCLFCSFRFGRQIKLLEYIDYIDMHEVKLKSKQIRIEIYLEMKLKVSSEPCQFEWGLLFGFAFPWPTVDEHNTITTSGLETSPLIIVIYLI